MYDKFVQTPEEVVKLQVVGSGETDLLQDGPPCLQILCKSKISEGAEIMVYSTSAFTYEKRIQIVGSPKYYSTIWSTYLRHCHCRR